MSTYNLENLYDFRDDPTDGCDFAGNTGCPGVSPPFDYVPGQPGGVRGPPGRHRRPDHRRPALARHPADPGGRGPGHLLGRGRRAACGGPRPATASPTRSRSWRWPSGQAGGGAYDAAYDRDGADDRGIVAAFLFRTDRVSLAPATADDPVLGADARRSSTGRRPAVRTPTCPTPRPSTPTCPPTSTRRPAPTATTSTPGRRRWPVPGGGRARLGRHVRPVGDQQPLLRPARRPGGPAHRAGRLRRRHRRGDRGRRPRRPGSWWAATSTSSPGPTTRSPPATRCSRPTSSARSTRPGLANLWDDLVADVPPSAYSYVFEGQAQTLDQLFVNGGCTTTWSRCGPRTSTPAGRPTSPATGPGPLRPRPAGRPRFSTRAGLSVDDVSVVEGDRGRRRPPSPSR